MSYQVPAKRRRDQQLRYHVRRLREACPHLSAPEFLPLVRSYVKITLMLETGYEHLRESFLNKEGEARPLVDTCRKLAETQARLARELRLTPRIRKELRDAGEPLELSEDTIKRVTEIGESFGKAVEQ